MRHWLCDTGTVSYRQSNIQQVPHWTVKHSECPTVQQWDILSVQVSDGGTIGPLTVQQSDIPAVPTVGSACMGKGRMGDISDSMTNVTCMLKKIIKNYPNTVAQPPCSQAWLVMWALVTCGWGQRVWHFWKMTMEMFMSFFPWQDEHKKEFEFFFQAISCDLQKVFNHYSKIHSNMPLACKHIWWTSKIQWWSS